MRTRIGWLAWLLALAGLLAPVTAWAQTNGFQEVPPAPGSDSVPYPLGHPRYEEGGFYTFGEFLLWTQSNPLKSQLLAFQGFTDRDGSIHQALGLPGGAGDFIGSRNPVLDVLQVSGPSSAAPGFNLGFGYRFRNGIAIEASWIHFWDVKYSATASPAIAGNPGQFLENTFISAPVFNYPNDYNGPGQKVNAPNANVGSASGIWNAASLMTIDFAQRFDIYQLNVRYPLQQTENWRTYGLFGPRIVWFWERFKWRTSDTSLTGETAPDDVAIYSNVVSNRLWGAHFGIGNEWEMGTTPVGTFSLSLDIEAGLYGDFVSTMAKYEIGDFHTAATRHGNQITLSPELEGKIALWWFPYEAIQIKLGYTGMVFFNTIASPRPVDFNFGSIAPPFEHGITRTIHGLDVGIAFVF